MAKFIKLTQTNNKPIYVNMDMVLDMSRNTSWTEICQNGDYILSFLDKEDTRQKCIAVKETPEEILEMMNR